MTRKVVMNAAGRLMVKKPPPTSWKPVELPRCPCGSLASWQHPTLGYRCNTCPRPEPPKVAMVNDAASTPPARVQAPPAATQSLTDGTLTARDAALLKLRAAMRMRGELDAAEGPEAELEQLAAQAKPALDVFGRLKADGLAEGWPQKLTPAGLEAANKITGPRSAR